MSEHAHVDDNTIDMGHTTPKIMNVLLLLKWPCVFLTATFWRRKIYFTSAKTLVSRPTIPHFGVAKKKSENEKKIFLKRIKKKEKYQKHESDQVTRKSTSGAVVMAEGMRLHAHSRGQASEALSSCEAEVMAASEGIKEALLLQEVLMFVGLGHYEIESRWTVVRHMHSSIDEVSDA